jgi:hypothetical protein
MFLREIPGPGALARMEADDTAMKTIIKRMVHGPIDELRKEHLSGMPTEIPVFAGEGVSSCEGFGRTIVRVFDSRAS